MKQNVPALTPAPTRTSVTPLLRRRPELTTVSRKVTLWAWGTSLAAHVIIILAVVLFGSRGDTTPQPAAQAAQVRLEQPLPVEPPPVTIENLMVESPAAPLPLLPPAPPEQPSVAIPATPISTSAGEGFTINAPPALEDLPATAAAAVFCGSSAQGRYLCYVVDCSGSMVMALDYIRAELCRSLEGLTPGQHIRLILFAGSAPFIWPAEGYRRANAAARREAVTFVQSLQLQETPGTAAASDAVVQAIVAALTPDASGASPEAIYLLTDGEFEHQTVARRLLQLQAKRTTPAAVHVIACGNPDNELFLRQLARSYQGSYRFISDDELAQAGRRLSSR